MEGPALGAVEGLEVQVDAAVVEDAAEVYEVGRGRLGVVERVAHDRADVERGDEWDHTQPRLEKPRSSYTAVECHSLGISIDCHSLGIP